MRQLESPRQSTICTDRNCGAEPLCPFVTFPRRRKVRELRFRLWGEKLRSLSFARREPPCHFVTFPLSGGTKSLPCKGSWTGVVVSPMGSPPKPSRYGGFGGERRRCTVTELFAFRRKRGIRSHRRRGSCRQRRLRGAQQQAAEGFTAHAPTPNVIASPVDTDITFHPSTAPPSPAQ